MENRFYDLNTYFKNIFGHRVHKITVDAGMSCPNRDGTLSTRGCIFCNQSGSGTIKKAFVLPIRLSGPKNMSLNDIKQKNLLPISRLIPTPMRPSTN